MKKVKSVTAAFALSVILCSTAFSQQQTVYNFLKLDVDARSSAMAGNFVALPNDANAIFYNPAVLATGKGTKASVGFFKYLLDINSGNAAYTMKYKDLGYIGAGVRFVNYGSFDKYDENFNQTGTFSANDIALSLGYANQYKERFNYGANVKFIYSSIDEYSSLGAAVDLGFLYYVPETYFGAGISLLNLGTQLSSYYGTREDLPLDLRIGVSKKLDYLPLTFTLGLTNLTDSYDKFYDRFKNIIVGGELTVSDYVTFRIGYSNPQRQNLKTGSSIGIAGFSAGLGIKFMEKYHIDYAFNSMGKIGSTHRFNIGFDLN
jgi:hypothetical protein